MWSSERRVFWPASAWWVGASASWPPFPIETSTEGCPPGCLPPGQLAASHYWQWNIVDCWSTITKYFTCHLFIMDPPVLAPPRSCSRVSSLSSTLSADVACSASLESLFSLLESDLTARPDEDETLLLVDDWWLLEARGILLFLRPMDELLPWTSAICSLPFLDSFRACEGDSKIYW